MESASSSKSCPAEKFIHKNRLQEYVQKSALSLPVYQTVSKGSPHALQFQSTVLVDGVTFSSEQSFSSRKEAEQHVANVALQGISKKIEQEGCPLIHADTTFCKSILHEYAAKMNLEKPTYTCSQLEGLLPTFISSVSFAGKMYKGCHGRNKKEAQQLGARAVIESILGDCDSSARTLMSQIIKSKGKFYVAINHINDFNISPVMHLASEGNLEKLFLNSLAKGKEVQSALTNKQLVAGHAVALHSRQISEACPANPGGLRPKEVYVHDINIGSTGSGSMLAHQPQDDPQAAVVYLSSDTINHINESSVAPMMHLASEGKLENPLVDGLVRGEKVPSSLTNARQLVTGHAVSDPSRQISEACPTHVEGMKPKEKYMHKVKSSSTGCGSLLPHQPQDGLQAAVVSFSHDAIPDGSHPRVFSAVNIERSECMPSCCSYGEPSGFSTSPLVGPSGLPSQTQKLSSTSKKRRSKKGKGECRRSKSKKSRTGCLPLTRLRRLIRLESR